MTDQREHHPQPDLHPEDRPGLEKDPADWVSGDEPMTGAQAPYLETLARQTGADVPSDLTKARASELIDELRAQAGRQDAREEDQA